MNATALETATVTVLYIGQPKEGKQFGFVKDTTGNTFPAKPDKLRQFEVGETYEVAFNTADNGFRNLVAVKHLVAAAHSEMPKGNGTTVHNLQGKNGSNGTVPHAPNKEVPQFYRPTAPRDSERMFTCALAGHWIATGRVEMTEEGMIGLVNSLRSVYAATFGRDDGAA